MVQSVTSNQTAAQRLDMLEFLQEHPIIRDLSVYEELVCVSFTKEPVVCTSEIH